MRQVQFCRRVPLWLISLPNPFQVVKGPALPASTDPSEGQLSKSEYLHRHTLPCWKDKVQKASNSCQQIGGPRSITLALRLQF